MADSRLYHNARALLRQMTGKYYPEVEKVMSGMNEAQLLEFHRMLRDLESEKTSAVRRAQLEPWRCG